MDASAVNSVFITTSNKLGAFESGIVVVWGGAMFSVVVGGVGTLIVVALAAVAWTQLRRLGPLHKTLSMDRNILHQVRARLHHWKLRFEARYVVRTGVWVRRAPVIAVTGTNGKTTTVHLIDRMLRAAGYKVGTCTTYGVYQNGVRVAVGDRAGHRGIWRALHCPGLQVVVAEVGRGGMLCYGPGFSTCRVGVVTNVLADHLGLEGVWTLDQMAEAKSEIARRTHPSGAVVLNADDPRVAAMTMVSRASPIFFTVAGRENEFDRGWFLRDGWLWRKDDAREGRLLPATEMPMTFGGHQRYNIANALAALAAIEGISDTFPVPRQAQLTVLREYERDYRDYPVGRFILARFRGHYVLLLHCKNPDAYRLEAPMIRRVQEALGCRYLVGVASSVGNREEDYHRSVSEEIAGLSDGVFLRPPVAKYLRGMAPEEMMRRLSSGLKPGQLLSVESLTMVETIERTKQRFGESFLLAYFVASYDPLLKLNEFLLEAEVVPVPTAALEGAP
ncbi:hypothetical protein CLG94_05665 [Candidatus Methylomirabilis limnetica]|uniref:Mur ligase central domain-containing protein n=1 Tax=Candidatus Methylomirabilis limnetica TaxID=2033718 RepID=A0A2T4TYH7_9BACT|nr:Mur ligase family protein [Candidatus Methylomirabilis limnetica]PTL36149.1 hypothetical protein CLG94_05665 [Candidatus Methylomirabilis limnetica]